MKEKAVNKFLVNALIIILATAIAILVHAVMPAGVNEEDLNGALVQLLGFPLISVFYFILLFTHCAVVVQYFGKKANKQRLQIGSRFGLAFALIYLFGMQEVSVETSPFAEWGSTFVNYQFFMGVGDAIPVLLLCITIAYFLLNNTNPTSSVKTLSSCHTYSVPCYLWTMIFGMVLGGCYVILYPLFAREQNPLSISVKLAVLTIGANWMIFNSFIGLIFNGYMLQTLLRSGIDTAVLFLISLGVYKYVVKTDKGLESTLTDSGCKGGLGSSAK